MVHRGLKAWDVAWWSSPTPSSSWLWLRHGGIDASHGPGGLLTRSVSSAAAGRVRVAVAGAADGPDSSARAGVRFDRLARLHDGTASPRSSSSSVHTAAITLDTPPPTTSDAEQTADFVNHYADVLMAIVGTELLA